MRRAVLLALSVAGAALAVAPAAPARHTPFSMELRVPKTLTRADHDPRQRAGCRRARAATAQRRCLRRLARKPIELTMRQAGVQSLEGRKTPMWTFNGSFPGPTLMLRSGEPTKVRVTNRLGRDAGAMSIHHHGSHSQARDDGQPGPRPTERLTDFERTGADAGLMIPPGASRTYTYGLREAGEPERAAFQWYHDHRTEVSARNVWLGLAGMAILSDRTDRRLPLPKGRYDVPLMVADRSYLRDNSLTNPFPAPIGDHNDLLNGRVPPNDGVVGDHVIVNGVAQPFMRVEPRRYRLRILNAANFQLYNLRLSDGGEMTQIATESGLLPRPVNRSAILLGPGERAEVVVDFAARRGKTVVLESVAREDAGRGATGSSLDSVMQFRVGTRAVRDRSRVPAALRPAPSFDTERAVARTWDFGLGVDPQRDRPAWTINGKVFEPGRIDARPKLGATEVWQLRNSSTVSHAVHMHSVDFRVIARDGRPPPPWEDGLKETVLVDPGETVTVATRFTDHTGPFALHCHMLEHEDNGMMTHFEVVAEESSAARRPASAPRLGQRTRRRERGHVA